MKQKEVTFSQEQEGYKDGSGPEFYLWQGSAANDWKKNADDIFARRGGLIAPYIKTSVISKNKISLNFLCSVLMSLRWLA